MSQSFPPPQADAILDVVAYAPDTYERLLIDVTVRSPHAKKCGNAASIRGTAALYGEADKLPRYEEHVKSLLAETYGRSEVETEETLWKIEQTAARMNSEMSPSVSGVLQALKRHSCELQLMWRCWRCWEPEVKEGARVVRVHLRALFSLTLTWSPHCVTDCESDRESVCFPTFSPLVSFKFCALSEILHNVTKVRCIVRWIPIVAGCVVGTTAGSRRSGTKGTSGIAQSAARALTTTVFVAEAAKNTLGSFCKNQQRTAANAAAATARDRQWTKKPSEGHSTRR